MHSTQQTLTKDSLLNLWHSTGKHGVYQQLPDFLSADFGVKAPVDERWRGDRTRLDYLRTRMDFKGLRVTDIGANTGFFSLTLAHDLGAQVTAIEPDPANRDFLREVARAYDLSEMGVSDDPVTLSTVGQLPTADMVLLLNVLHHAGDDFDSTVVRTREDMPGYLTQYLTALAGTTRRMVFQLGYNWHGNKATPLVPVREPLAMLGYLEPIFNASGWACDHIALRFDVDDPRMIELVYVAGNTQLAPASQTLAELPAVKDLLAGKPLDKISEFYARPLIICTSKA
jgi:SAM-dependent methyltransferase